MEPAHVEDERRAAVRAAIRCIPDFPKAGIMFQDVTTLLLQPVAFRHCIDLLVEHCRGLGLDAVAGFEARGFLFGPPVALALGLPFVLLRKPKKLPGACGRDLGPCRPRGARGRSGVILWPRTIAPRFRTSATPLFSTAGCRASRSRALDRVDPSAVGSDVDLSAVRTVSRRGEARGVDRRAVPQYGSALLRGD